MSDLISRQAAIDMFQNMAYDDWNQGVSTSWADAFSECAEMIRDLPSAQPEQRWIPVGEGKPKDGTVCLITYSNGFVKIATFAEDLYEFDEYDFQNKRGVAGWYYLDDEWGMYFEVDNVVAWMPLPEPYKEEER